MKKPHVLNRPMFNTGGTSAYGRGISANLITEEQRQRFNNGGRVKYYEDYRGGPVYMGGTDIPQWWDPSWGPVLQTGDQRGRIWDPDRQEYVSAENIYKVKGAELGEEKMDYIPTTLREMQEAAGKGKRKITDIEDIDIDYMKSQAGSKRDDLERSLGYDIGTPVEGGGTKYEVSPTEPDRVFGEPRKSIFGPIKETEVVGEEEPSLAGIPGELDPLETRKDDTDLLDTPDRWAFLDEHIAKKKKLARGHAAWEGAATALDWGFAGTPEAQAAAVSKGLRKVGGIGAKYKGEAEDIKTKAKILGTVEDIKSEGKLDLWDKKLKEYYGKSLDIQGEEFELKKEVAEATKERLKKEEDPKTIYKSYTLPKPGDILTGQRKKELLKSFTNRNLTVEDDKNSKDLRDPEKNKGLVFIDINGNIVRNDGTGTIKDVDEYTDEYFTWIKP